MAKTTTGNPDKDKALSMVLNQIERNFGKGSIMRLGDASSHEGRDYFQRGLDLGFSPGGRDSQRPGC
jgi:recombination protein RecA